MAVQRPKEFYAASDGKQPASGDPESRWSVVRGSRLGQVEAPGGACGVRVVPVGLCAATGRYPSGTNTILSRTLEGQTTVSIWLFHQWAKLGCAQTTC
jgi:hypothetical protein